MHKTTNVPPPEDEEEFAYVYNARSQTVHKWPGCYAVERMEYPAHYWTRSQFLEATRERGAIRRCRLCFGKP